MQGAGDVALVALRLLAHVEHLHRAVLEQPFQLAELDGLELLRRVDVRDVARELEKADRAEAARRAVGLPVVGRMDDDPFVGT